METKECFSGIFEWRIENFSNWSKDLHGKCIDSPPFSSKYFTKMELYPRGRNATGESMMVRIHDVENVLRGEFSFFGPDGCLIGSQRVKGPPENSKKVLDVPGQRHEAVVSEIKKIGDQLTMRFCIRSEESYEKSMCTRLDVLKMSLKIDERSIKIVERGYLKYVAFVPFNESDTDWGGLQSKAATRKGETFEGLLLKAARKNGKLLQLLLEHVNKKRSAVSVKSCMSVLRRGCSLKLHEVKDHVFRDGATSWTLSDGTIKMEDLIGKNVALLLRFKIVTGSVTHSYHHAFYECKGVSVVPYKDMSDGVTSNKTDESVASELTKELMRLCRDDPDFSDVTLKCGTASFPVHRAILSARSPVFARLLLSSSNDKREAESKDIDDLDPPTLSRFLVFLYTGTLDDLEWESALKLYYAAQKYQVQTLRVKCSVFIRSVVSLSNVCEALCVADQYQDEEITSAAHEFILENYNDVLRSEEWRSFMKREPLLAVEMVTHFGVKNSVGKRDPQ